MPKLPIRPAAALAIGIAAVVLTAFAATPAAGAAAPDRRPNILWITCEDLSPMLGCYGDRSARTPHLDALAAGGVRYTNAFAYTGVCAPSRSCLITGVYPARLGSLHMRSTTGLPAAVKCFPEYLRAAGYYCTNNRKEDYNFKTPATSWDESSAKAHWRNRPAGAPFFAVFNFMTTHQSQVFGDDRARAAVQAKLKPGQAHADADVAVPPIHPDVPAFRREWAWYHDNASQMDAQAGQVLAQLDADGLAEDTIVFFFSDHGTGLPDVKMWAWDRSLRVPLIVRTPERWQSQSPGRPGTATDRLVSFVDFAPTVLGLCGVDVPGHLQGTAFVGPAAGEPRGHVFAAKDRQGERFDTVRSVHDKRFHYLRNFRPELPWSQHISYVDQHPSMRAWQALHDAGQLSGPLARFFRTKPAEELYDVSADPWETNNLAADPRYAADLARLRAECEGWMVRTGDLGLLPEYEMHRRAAGSTPYEIATDTKLNPVARLIRAATPAAAEDVPALARDLLGEEDAAVRWWAAVRLVAVGQSAQPAADALRRATGDESPDVRIAAAEALANIGRDGEALPVLTAALEHESPLVRLAAMNALDRMGPRAAPALPAIGNAGLKHPAHPDAAEYVGRMAQYLPSRVRSAAR